MKKYFIIFPLIAILIYLPSILLPIAVSLYNDKFYNDVTVSLEKIVSDQPYCIVAPRVAKKEIEGDRYYFYREWTVIQDPLKIDIRHVLDHAIREKLIFYAREGRSIQRRAELGREMHFGLAVANRFYIWSFKKGKFVSLDIPGSVRYLEELKRKYTELSKAQRSMLTKNAITIDPEDYYCSLSYQ